MDVSILILRYRKDMMAPLPLFLRHPVKVNQDYNDCDVGVDDDDDVTFTMMMLMIMMMMMMTTTTTMMMMMMMMMMMKRLR